MGGEVVPGEAWWFQPPTSRYMRTRRIMVEAAPVRERRMRMVMFFSSDVPASFREEDGEAAEEAAAAEVKQRRKGGRVMSWAIW